MAEGVAHRLGAMRDRASQAGRERPEASQAALIGELRALAASFDIALRDVAALRLPDALGHVPDAASELDAVVQHTATATETILDQCERLEELLAESSFGAMVSEAAMRIYEACSFQDIVGQRLTKVVRTLQALESKTAEILRVFGPMPDDIIARRDAPVPAHDPMLAGPALGRPVMDQSAIDALLAGA